MTTVYYYSDWLPWHYPLFLTIFKGCILWNTLTFIHVASHGSLSRYCVLLMRFKVVVPWIMLALIQSNIIVVWECVLTATSLSHCAVTIRTFRLTFWKCYCLRILLFISKSSSFMSPCFLFLGVVHVSVYNKLQLSGYPYSREISPV